jgi:hypothetical protein
MIYADYGKTNIKLSVIGWGGTADNPDGVTGTLTMTDGTIDAGG